jgi:uridine kinase
MFKACFALSSWMFYMKPTLIIFSGLPGTGKTTLARLLAVQLRVPLVRLDDMFDIIPEHMLAHANPFWDDLMQIVLRLAEAQLSSARMSSRSIEAARLTRNTLATLTPNK